MQLKNHPLMRYGSIRNWPPVWISLHEAGEGLPLGEVGVLTEVRKSQFHADRLVLVMEYEEDLYGAAVTFSDAASCNRIFEFLKNSVGLSIEDIGNIDLTRTL